MTPEHNFSQKSKMYTKYDLPSHGNLGQP